jgi:uncharacterized protein (DUF2147 family)
VLRAFAKVVTSVGAIAVIAASQPGPSAEGRWLTEKKNGIIEIFRCSGGDRLCGRLLWFRIKPGDPDQRGLDTANPKPELRNRPLCGLVFMTGFKPAEPGSWEDGRVYDSDDGNTYGGTMRLQPDGTLRLRGYVVITLIGGSEVWTRQTGPVPQCPSR